MRKIFSILAAASVLVSCVYDYDVPQVEDVSGLVVEGDIFIGKDSEFVLSRLMPVSSSYGRTQTVVPDQLWVESDSGEKYTSVSAEEGVYNVPTSHAAPGHKYRLHIEMPGGKVYESAWSEPEGSCILDSLSYIVPKVNLDIDPLQFCVSLHTDGSSRHFRYRYEETWKYHSIAQAYVYFVSPDEEHEFGQLLDYKYGTAPYYCYNGSKSRGINLATTETMDEDRLVNYPIIRYHRDNRRISHIYRLDVDVYPVSADSYAFYEHLKEMSSLSGDLFAPMPSEMRGNIRCKSDPDEMVYGYVAVVQPVSARMYYVNDGYYLRRYNAVDIERVEVDMDRWDSYYRRGWLPVEANPMVPSVWMHKECVDCRYEGGSMTPPDDWLK